jgi:Mn-dependent DtxR family transcriptional regulator
MSSEWLNLGKSLEDYLERILLLGLSNEKIRVTDLALKLGVKKPSVVSALRKLAEEE